jgi:oligogalacturonide lyase
MQNLGQRLDRNGKQILFVSDMSGYGNLYLVDTPDFDRLAPFE